MLKTLESKNLSFVLQIMDVTSNIYKKKCNALFSFLSNKIFFFYLQSSLKILYEF
jgi:hypothetical protein